MGSMTMGGELPLLDYPKMYWAVVGTAVGLATMVNLYNHLLYKQRMSAAQRGLLKPAKPKSALAVTLASTFAIVREVSNFSLRMPFRGRIFHTPTVGRASLVLANLVVLIVLCFYGFDVNDRWKRQDIGFRCGFVTIGQIPLLFLLAGKNNIIGFLSGISHERLNWIHRWCARCMLLTATLHMGYQFADWAPYDYIGVQLKENKIVKRGMVAWAMLAWIVISSATPIRGWCYELFVVQHLISFAVFIGFVYVHTPDEVHPYIWLCVALFFFDRVLRAIRAVYANLSIFHPKQRAAGEMAGFGACKAEFTPLAHNTTRIVIHNPPISWKPGQHVFLSCHSIVPLQSHPFTIASIPADGRMEFLVKAETGGTKRFFNHAERNNGLPQPSERFCMRTVAIEGPYGNIRPLRQFDSVVLLAGSTGVTFTAPLLRDILQGWSENVQGSSASSGLFSRRKGAVTRHVRFVWVVKSRGQLEWLSEQLSAVYADFETLQEKLRGIKLEMTMYVTCDNTFTEEHKTLLSTIAAPSAAVPKGRRELPAYTLEMRSSTPSTEDRDKKDNVVTDDIREIPASVTRSSTDDIRQRCGPDGTCCCRAAVDEDEDSPDAITQCCCCNKDSTQPNAFKRSCSRLSSSQTSSSRPKPLVHPSISVFSGRPRIRDIIRKSLEQALGESAVVVCGPQGLVADVKYDVCALSDERAIHKGTGAQGVYLHTESFGY